MFDSTALEFGLINTLHTGDGLIDALACVLVPTLVQRLRNYVLYERLMEKRSESAATSLTYRERLVQWIFGRQDAIHTIEFKQFSGGSDTVLYGEDKDMLRNYLLQKAFAVYLARHLDVRDQRYGRYELVSAPNDSTVATTLMQSKNEIGMLCVGAMPPLGKWVVLDAGIEFMQEEVLYDPSLRDKIQEVKTLFHLRTRHQGGTKRVNSIISKAYADFQELESRKNGHDGVRYMYIHTSKPDSAASDPGEDKPSQARMFKRYALGEEKTFETVFFDEKHQLLQLLTDFHHRTGKFAIEGFPYKLGLLLHGPPGTGKTSIIKAIAQMTGRHVVTISLSKIKTNQELMEAMFDLQFKVPDIELPVTHKFSEIVFVLEDIDCATDVVAARSTTAEDTTPRPAERASPSEQLMTELIKSYKEVKTGIIGGVSSLASDKLTLSGLLNVLDGVVDCPGRIVIMSTNHPDKLDPALIRPGRVNEKLLLGHMSAKSMQAMLEYFFSTALTQAQVARLESLEKQFTPAEIEALCAEFDSVDEIIAKLV